MKAFNSIQLVAFFAGTPFLISWLSEATFKFSSAAMWGASLGYVALFLFIWAAVYHGIDKLGD